MDICLRVVLDFDRVAEMDAAKFEEGLAVEVRLEADLYRQIVNNDSKYTNLLNGRKSGISQSSPW